MPQFEVVLKRVEIQTVIIEAPSLERTQSHDWDQDFDWDWNPESSVVSAMEIRPIDDLDPDIVQDS